jgi:hypothetical protein
MSACLAVHVAFVRELVVRFAPGQFDFWLLFLFSPHIPFIRCVRCTSFSLQEIVDSTEQIDRINRRVDHANVRVHKSNFKMKKM